MKPTNDELVEIYNALPRKAINDVLLVEYRCGRGCLVLHALQTKYGILYRIPPYRLSPERTVSDTSEDARQERTSDGYRRWTGLAGILDDLRGWGDTAGVSLQCDHINEFVPSTVVLADADAAIPGRPTRKTF